MSDQISIRELRNRTADVLLRVEAGERLRVTVDGRPVAELAALHDRDAWVTRRRAVAALVPSDSELARDLARVLPDTIDLL